MSAPRASRASASKKRSSYSFPLALPVNRCFQRRAQEGPSKWRALLAPPFSRTHLFPRTHRPHAPSPTHLLPTCPYPAVLSSGSLSGSHASSPRACMGNQERRRRAKNVRLSSRKGTSHGPTDECRPQRFPHTSSKILRVCLGCEECMRGALPTGTLTTRTTLSCRNHYPRHTLTTRSTLATTAPIARNGGNRLPGLSRRPTGVIVRSGRSLRPRSGGRPR